MVTPKDSDMTVSLQGMEGGRVYLMARNGGVRAGSVTGAQLTVEHPMVPGEPLQLDLPMEPTLIPEGGTRQIVIPIDMATRRFIDNSWWDSLANAERPLKISFNVHYLNFKDQEPETSLLTPSIRTVMLAGGSDWHRCVVTLHYSDDWGRPFPDGRSLTRSENAKECGAYPWGELRGADEEGSADADALPVNTAKKADR
jgi:hypothetical protein